MRWLDNLLRVAAVAALVAVAWWVIWGPPRSATTSPVEPVNPQQARASDPLVPPEHLAAVSAYLDPGDLVGGPGAHAHPHGEQMCASGCAASNHPTKLLTRAEFDRLLSQYATEPMSSESQALESLLYYGRQTLLYLDRHGAGPLDESRAEFLRREAPKRHVVVHIRVVDASGVTRVTMPPARVPLDIRHEFSMETRDLQPLVTSGTVKRVGLKHLWQRL